MYLCVGTFLTTLKLCKASTTKQKKLGEAVFRTIKPGFDCGDDDSSISAVFRGKRNLHSFLQLEFDDINPKMLSLRFAKEVIPLLDENRKTHAVRLLLSLIKDDYIDDETHVELVNRIKKKNLLLMDEIVFEDFLAGVFLYTIKFTDNLNVESEVKVYKHFAEREILEQQKKLSFISQYMDSPFFEDDTIRSVITLYKQGGTIIDVLYADIFEIVNKEMNASKKNIVIPSNTSFETKLEDRVGNDVISLVSENTIHGQWIMSLEKKGINLLEIDSQIQNSLKRSKISKCKVRNTTVGKQDVYPIASVARVVISNINYYLLALSDFDDNNKAQSNISNIRKVINTVIDYYDVEGQGYDIYIPLIGTGRSRTGLTLQDSYELIKELLLQRKDEIFGRVHIVIYPAQADEVYLEV